MKPTLKAFTLIELLVAMVVSSVVIASSYFIYSTFSKNLVDYRRHSNKLSDAAVFNGILAHDINLSYTVKRGIANEIALLDKNNGMIRYEWKEEVILRISGNSVDTFNLPVKNAEMSFAGKEQVISDELIDELKLTTISDEKEFTFCFEKKYGSDILVESEKHSYGGY